MAVLVSGDGAPGPMPHVVCTQRGLVRVRVRGRVRARFTLQGIYYCCIYIAVLGLRVEFTLWDWLALRGTFGVEMKNYHYCSCDHYGYDHSYD